MSKHLVARLAQAASLDQNVGLAGAGDQEVGGGSVLSVEFINVPDKMVR